MKTKLFILAALTIVLAITSINLYITNQRLDSFNQQAFEDIEATDDYWASVMGDYQLDVYMDTIWLRDDERIVSKFIMEPYDTDALSTAIMDDNQ